MRLRLPAFESCRCRWNTDFLIRSGKKDVATQGLARMNMILHGFATAEIAGGNTLVAPIFMDGNALKRFDYVVANPPFSDKEWSMGLSPEEDVFMRFSCGIPPAKNGDFAYLLHIIASMKATGKAVCVLPHGARFRGNAEAGLRQWLIRQGYISGIIGLPANLFTALAYPRHLLFWTRKNAQARKGIFMIDASQGFCQGWPQKTGCAKEISIKLPMCSPHAARFPVIPTRPAMPKLKKNGFNLNLPRYINNAAKRN